MLRNDAGKICGNKVATTLKKYATPVPIAISVNMLVLRFRTDAHPRWKNGQPPHSTTGVASSNSIHGSPQFHRDAINACGQNMLPMAIASSGAVSARLIQNRRVMSRSSGLSSSTVTVRGSSAMPQIGQLPGSARTISGCMGQVYSSLVAGSAGDSGSSAIPHLGQGPGPLCRTSGHIGQTEMHVPACLFRTDRSKNAGGATGVLARPRLADGAA